MSKVLVTGGAGYIGSHVVKLLLDEGVGVVVLDNLSNGYADAVPEGVLFQGDIGDSRLVSSIIREHDVDAVMNFASLIEVGESVKDPAGYYSNNVAQTLTLLETMVRCEVMKIIFSSTAAVFGSPEYSPIDEKHPVWPINPYGKTKWIIEEVLADYASAYGLDSVSLRYFNAAGAHPDGDIGERHEPETHLIPLVLQAASGRIPEIKIFGSDYDTRDGTCVRDFVHVMDLADAHLQGLRFLQDSNGAFVFNLGNGGGYSVSEVVAAAEKVTGRRISATHASRRPGDPSVLVADSSRASVELVWQPKYPKIETIVAHAWEWEQKRGKHW